MIMEKQHIFLIFLFLYVYQFNGIQTESLPVVLWHGMGDSCCFSFSLGAIKKLIENTIPNIYVHSIRLGNNEVEDVENSYFGNINDQIQEVCHQLLNDEYLKNGYNAIGFSQGAQFFRALIQRCPNPSVKNFISLGGQHQGVFGLPNCGTLKPDICHYVTRIIKYGAYLQFIQKKFIQATYWHDPYHEEEYKEKSTFLADINNEHYINKTYKKNLQKLHTMVLVKFDNDTIVRPAETELFGFYKSGQERLIQTLEQSDFYHKDRLGLKMLHNTGRIHFLHLPGNHLQFTEDWFVNYIIKPYLI
ncbi:palmitoyl-protein thioesterase 1 [Apis laboriosa]|uniref:palmitoyl-protein thioesterase 1 n=1 Tax=Apis laboriosa TaxID=183418 RepID=UPI001CC44C4C|nr:palmitoyl-protein thioesterase 1 [Apis laboriosa]